MNTPAHIVLSAVVLGRGRGRAHWLAITGGALLPDLPMFGFYFYERVGLGRSEAEIWSELYFDPGWQQFFDLFNSLPLIALGVGLALWKHRSAALVFLLSMALHVVADLPVHREDAHGHFFPISSWRFESPISYWDPEHYGRLVGSLELLGVVLGSIVLVRRRGPWRFIGLGCLSLYALFLSFALRVWASG